MGVGCFCEGVRVRLLRRGVIRVGIRSLGYCRSARRGGIGVLT